MELIPILSFIILVATISTFILAVGAYILYKIRESKGKIDVAPKPASVQAELYAPALKPGIVQHNIAYQEQPAFNGQKIPFNIQNRPEHIQAQERIYQQNEGKTNARFSSDGRRTYLTPHEDEPQQETEYPDETTNRKFMKYTSEGYVPVSKTKSGENLKWR